MKRIIPLILLLVSITAFTYADNSVTFSYEGRVKVSGQPFNGTGLFKLSILNTSATTTLWSNDGTVLGTGGNEPTAAFALTVTDGVFTVLVGDPAQMQPINSSLFNTRTPLKLRVWFSDGSHGFQQLNPDQSLVNLTFNTIATGDSDFTIYVNGATGNDNNNGLSSDLAKKTIQGGIDALPQQIRCNVTISVAPGVYREEVVVSGLAAKPGKSVTIQGDAVWTLASVGDPTVRIAGSDNDTVSSRPRAYNFHAQQCSGLVVKGLYFTYASIYGLYLENGLYTVQNCKASYAGTGGMMANFQSAAEFMGVSCTANTGTGVYLGNNSRVNFTGVNASGNTGFGIRILNQSNASFYSNAIINNNTTGGFQLRDLSMCSFQGGMTGSIQNNSSYAFTIVSGSMVLYSQSAFTISSNTGGLYQAIWGGQIYPVD